MRRHLTVVVFIAVAIALVTLSTGAYVLLSARLRDSADHSLTDRAESVIATLATRDGALTMLDTSADAVLDAGVWVFDSRLNPVVRASGTQELQAAVTALAGTQTDVLSDVPGPARLLARPFVLRGGVTGVVVVIEPMAPYDQTEHDAIVAMGIFGLLVLLITLLGTRLFLHVALRPVADMTRQAQDWSEHQPERRFAMGPVHDELTALAVMFDRLLARSASALRYEQRLTAEIAHELRAPLTRAAVVTELALRHQRPSEELLRALDEVGTEIRSTVVVLDTLLAAASLTSGPRGSGDAGQAARDACEEASRLPRAHALRVRTHEADGVPTIGCDTRHAARTLAPLLDNAVQAANSDVTVEVTVDPETAEVVLAVLDDGDGITDADAQVILGAGVRGSASAERAGTGLGLALANRLAQAAGGRITIVAGRTGRVELRLPSLASAGRA